MNEDLRRTLGSVGLDDLAEVVERSVTRIAEQTAAQATAPLRANQARDAEAALVRRASEELAAFNEEAPDWKDHEQAMLDLSARIHPTAGTSPREYLRTLYRLATKDRPATTTERADASPATRTPARKTAALPAHEDDRTFEDAAAAAREGVEWEAPRPAPTRSSESGRTLEDAFAAAKRGERWT